MPKLKTHKGAAKRVRLTATGKIKRGHSHARHILTKKTNKRKRHLDIDVLVAKADHDRVMSMLPYGRDQYGSNKGGIICPEQNVVISVSSDARRY